MAEQPGTGGLAETDEAALDIDVTKVCYIVVKARELDAREDVVEPDYASNAADDQCRQVLEAYADDPVFDELKQAIDDLNWDEQCTVVALAWVGRGTYAKGDWAEALQAAQDEHTDNTSLYLLGMPLLADYLEEGLAAFDLSCEDFEMGHL
ncbi:DUF3775 domain-containing protein [Ferruginivarius sediminum]|uniref:DUF3775 domain-containing protein n=1 Tax=Ferruginivarius sediminum TaxID=2661937 RepID=A0A369T641_9PROT|nr:DUF3775 domain-containing protein [Ferruginivarius sediminum]RDD60793.1 DUF3775 domain-containing protein [Ferruginivarius sediminum]